MPSMKFSNIDKFFRLVMKTNSKYFFSKISFHPANVTTVSVLGVEAGGFTEKEVEA